MRQIALTFINFLFDLAYILLVVRAFLTYLPHNRFHPVIKPAYEATEPILSLIRNGLPPSKIGFDASPFIAIVLLYLVQQLLYKAIILI
jgi:YggT family protein